MSVRQRVLEYFVYHLHRYCPEFTVIIAKQGVAVKAKQCVIVDLMAEKSLGDQQLWDKDTETVTVAGLREATLNIQAYGKGSVELLAGLWGYFELPTVVDEFQQANIAVNIAGDVQNLTNILDNARYLERASVDYTISYDRSVVDSPEWFDVVYAVITLTTRNNTIETTKTKINIYTDIDIEKGDKNGEY